MDELPNLDLIAAAVLSFVTSTVPAHMHKEAHIKLFLSSPGSGHSWDSHTLPATSKSLSHSERSAIAARLNQWQANHPPAVTMRPPVIDVPSAHRCRFAWEAASYLLHHDDVRQPHIGMIDLGESNLHVAFFSPEEARVVVEYHEHLGLLQARSKFFSSETWAEGKKPSAGGSSSAACEPSAEDPQRWQKCVEAVEQVFLQRKEGAGCNSPEAPCKITQLQLPSTLTTKFVTLRLLSSLLAYAQINTKLTDLASLAQAGEQYCASTLPSNSSRAGWAELHQADAARKAPEAACFDYAYVSTLLHHGFGFGMRDEALLYKDNSDDVVGARDAIWLMGAMIVAIRDEAVAASTTGVDAAYTRVYLWAFQGLFIAVVYCLIKHQFTVVLLHLSPRKSSLAAAPAPSAAGSLDLYQRSLSGGDVRRHTWDAQEVTLLRTASTGSLPPLESKPLGPAGQHHRSMSGDSSDGSTSSTSRRVTITLGSGPNSGGDDY
eukprot:TRINITY_DN3222_c0_g1_i2.p1 TRINITY_DN3222_c0_g1~~TRINITY_DN3222_c0_g1_i2.p1  ORF type:complete len:490 (+),score=134.72 TRINITY_DN3222_c0_g1_i2:434-1903(+)